MPGLPSGNGLGRSEPANRWRSRPSQDEPAGVHTCGAGWPVAFSSQPLASASMAAPDALLYTLTSAHLPPKVRPLALYLPASSESRAAFSLDDEMASGTQLPRFAAALFPPPPEGLSTRYVAMIATSPTTTAMISGSGLRRLGEVSNTTAHASGLSAGRATRSDSPSVAGGRERTDQAAINSRTLFRSCSALKGFSKNAVLRDGS